MIKRKAKKPPPRSAEEKEGRALRQRLDEKLDEALKETFPASDPIAITRTPELD